MNKEKIVEELNNFVKSVDNRFGVTGGGHDLNLIFNKHVISYFSRFKIDRFIISFIDDNEAKVVLKSHMLNIFYNKAVEILKQNEKKYTIKVVNNDRGYLFFDDIAKEYSFANKNNKFFKSYFTQSEIEELKQQADIAIDWDKAIIKEVTD